MYQRIKDSSEATPSAWSCPSLHEDWTLNVWAAVAHTALGQASIQRRTKPSCDHWQLRTVEKWGGGVCPMRSGSNKNPQSHDFKPVCLPRYPWQHENHKQAEVPHCWLQQSPQLCSQGSCSPSSPVSSVTHLYSQKANFNLCTDSFYPRVKPFHLQSQQCITEPADERPCDYIPVIFERTGTNWNYSPVSLFFCQLRSIPCLHGETQSVAPADPK